MNPEQKKALRIKYALQCLAEDREDYALAEAAAADGGPTYSLEEVMRELDAKWIKGRKKQRGGKKK
jgi:hypothetical protein